MVKVKDFKDLENINVVSWSIRENADGCMISPERIAIRFVDVSGKYWEVCTYWKGYTDEMNHYYEYVAGKILNCIFHSLGLMKDRWIGYNCTLSEAVNQCRKELQAKHMEEEKYFLQKQYVF